MKLRMLAWGPLVATFLVALTLSVVWAASSPIDDPYSTANPQWNGTSELAKMGFTAVTWNLADTLSSTDSPAVLLILGPTRQFTQADVDSLRSFVSAGRVLVMADNVGSGNALLELLGIPIRFDGRVLIDPLFYRKQPTFPITFDLPPSDLSLGIDQVVMNHATVLTILPESNVRVLASSTPFSFVDTDNDGKKDPEELSGGFPVLAEVSMDKGTVILFSSPASFENDLINEADNSVLLQNIVKSTSQPNRVAVCMLDQTHLDASPFTPAKLAAQELVAGVVSGGMALSFKLVLTAIAITIVAGRFMYRRPSSEAPKGAMQAGHPSLDIDSVLRLHPTWDRGKLEYVAREIEASMRWRRLREPS